MVEADSITNQLYRIKLGSENYEKELEKAENFKKEGNELVKQNKFPQAIEAFTKAIDLEIETSNNSIYYSNRAFMHIKMENFGLALEDSDKAISIDPKYVKAYYRRASANLCLRKFDEAIKDLETLQKYFPDNEDIKLKLSNSKNERRKKRFLESIDSNQDRQTTKGDPFKKLEDLKVETTYSGQVFPEDGQVSCQWAEELMNGMAENKFIHKKFLAKMIRQLKNTLEKQPTIVDIQYENEFTVCGDTHGQFYDLMNIFKINGLPSKTNPYLFNGDFVDRGSFSVEVICTLLAWKLALPNHFFLSRGNHESKNLNKMYGFEGEVRSKYDDNIYDCFCELFCALPLGHVLNSKVFVVHGGLFSRDGVRLDELRKIDRLREPPESGLMCEILWSDPCKENGRHPSKRGVGLSFGPDVTERFLKDNGLEMLVRSHEVKQEGYEVEANGRLVTVFSAPNYCDQMGNKGAMIRFNKDAEPKYIQFTAVEHPKVPPMRYANPWMFF